MILPSDFDIRMGGRQTIDEKNTIHYIIGDSSATHELGCT